MREQIRRYFDQLEAQKVLASGKLGKGGRDVGNNSETFHRDLAGNQARPGELGRRPEASFASWGSDTPGEA